MTEILGKKYAFVEMLLSSRQHIHRDRRRRYTCASLQTHECYERHTHLFIVWFKCIFPSKVILIQHVFPHNLAQVKIIAFSLQNFEKKTIWNPNSCVSLQFVFTKCVHEIPRRAKTQISSNMRISSKSIQWYEDIELEMHERLTKNNNNSNKTFQKN